MTANRSQKRVLVIGLQGLGNLVLTSPLFHALHSSGQCAVTVLVNDRASVDLLSCYGFLTEVINAADFSRLGLVRRLRRGRYQAVLVAFPGGPRTNLLAWTTGAPVRLGHQARRARLARLVLTRALPVAPNTHDTDLNLDLYRELAGIWSLKPESDAPDFGMSLPTAAVTEAARWFGDHGLDPQTDPVIGLVPGCGRNQPFKRWPLENFFDLAAKLHATRPDLPLVWFFGPDENDLREQLAELPAHLTGRVAADQILPVTLALLAGCRALVTNDSGPMHMANAQGVPTVSLFGPSSDRRTGPTLPASQVLAVDLPCRPCNTNNVVDFRCTHEEHLACLHRITVSEVAEALLALLPGNAGSASP